MEITNELLKETALHLEPYFKANLNPAFEYRDFVSTLKLVQTCDLISVQTDLQLEDRMKITLAAWFQNTGFCIDPVNYQKASAELAANYFQEKGLSPKVVQEIKESILSTRNPRQPVTIQAQILCDAESCWMADKSFFQTLDYLRKENILLGKNDVQENNWLQENIRLLENHIYFNPVSKKMFDKRKGKNLLGLKERFGAMEVSSSDIQKPLYLPKKKEKKNKSLFDDIKLERGVETLFRNTARNQIHLIRLADYKANMIISINAIIISVILSVLIIRLDTNQYLEMPTLILILTNIFTILIAISATRPKINREDEELKDVRNSLLYYGNFYKMPFDKFSHEIKETLVDKDDLYECLTKDIYHQGIILVKKFRKINLSYTVFITGLILSICGFAISFLHHIHSI